MPNHARRPSAGLQQRAPAQNDAPQPSSHSSAQGRKHRRSSALDSPALLRLPSTSSRGTHDRDPSTPTTLTPGQVSTSPATSPSYFSPQTAASGKEARSPANRKPPAFFSGHGIDSSRGPPNSLITRGNVDIGRRSQNPHDFAFAQQQLLQLGLVSPGGTPRRRRGSESSGDFTPQSQTPSVSRQNSTRRSRREQQMESSVDGSSVYGSGLRSESEDTQARNYAGTAAETSGTDNDQGEDLFIAEAANKEPPTRAERLRSRIAIRSNRQSFPSTVQSNSTTPQTSRLPSAIDTSSGTQHRRASHTSGISRAQREHSPLSPINPLGTPRSRHLDLSPKPSFSSPRSRDSDLSPQQFLSQFSGRRSSIPDAVNTPPSRTHTYRPSNLHYSTPRDQAEAPHHEVSHEKGEGTESQSLDSTGPAASVWDELDDLKSRIRRIELGGKVPTTSGAAVAQATADRPRTANTSVTTVSSSPKQVRRTDGSPAESTVGALTPHKVHPLLREALAKTKQVIAPTAYRALEATANEAMALSESAGSAGPQGTLHSASSVLNGSIINDRQVRRKADNICRSLTELCIELCSDNKSSIASPAIRSVAAGGSRRPSVQINGESPQIRASIEPDSDTLRHSSPSRAMSRIEARRTSLMMDKVNGRTRDVSQEPPASSQSGIPNRLSRAGTSLHRTRRNMDDEDEDPTLRAPSRAMTDFRDTRASASNRTKRFSREYTSQEPMPELQPSPSLQYNTPARRPTVTGAENNSSLLFRDGSRRYDLNRQNSPAYERSPDVNSRLAQPSTQYASKRVSTGGIGLGRAGSLSRRLRGASTGE